MVGGDGGFGVVGGVGGDGGFGVVGGVGGVGVVEWSERLEELE